MFARIYRPARTAMQSGQAKTKDWVLEFEPEMARRIDPVMGWVGTGDTKRQVHLRFETRDAAIAYARKHGIPHKVREPKTRGRVIKSYADNFAYDRKQPWSH